MTCATAMNKVSAPFCLALLVLSALFWMPAEPLIAQGPEPADLIPIYGFDDDEFIIGGWATKWALPDTSSSTRDVSHVWKFIQAMGLNLYFTNGAPWQIDDIYGSIYREEGTHRLRTSAATLVFQSAFARGIRFFPFDTIQVKFPGTTDLAERGWYFYSTPVS